MYDTNGGYVTNLKKNVVLHWSFLDQYSLVATKIIYFDPLSKVQEELKLVDINESDSVSDNTTNLSDNVSMLLYIKDRFGISDAAWKELCSFM